MAKDNSRVVKLLEVSGTANDVSVNRHAIETLNGEGDFRFMCLLGPTRSGKSFLLNYLLGKENYFTVMNSESVTVGIDMTAEAFSLNYLRERFRLSSIENGNSVKIRLLDTEGMGNRTSDYDYKVVLPALLISTVIVINFPSRLGRSEFLNRMSTLDHLCKKLLTALSKAKTGSTAKMLGHLHIVFRNWTSTDSAETYYSHLLTDELDLGDEEEEQLQVMRGRLLKSFASIKIHTFPMAAAEGSTIAKHHHLPFQMVDPAFTSAVKGLMEAATKQLLNPTPTLLGKATQREKSVIELLHSLVEQIRANPDQLALGDLMQSVYTSECKQAYTLGMTAAAQLREPSLPKGDRVINSFGAGRLSAAVNAFESSGVRSVVPETANAPAIANAPAVRIIDKYLSDLKRDVEQLQVALVVKNAQAVREVLERETTRVIEWVWQQSAEARMGRGRANFNADDLMKMWKDTGRNHVANAIGTLLDGEMVDVQEWFGRIEKAVDLEYDRLSLFVQIQSLQNSVQIAGKVREMESMARTKFAEVKLPTSEAALKSVKEELVAVSVKAIEDVLKTTKEDAGNDIKSTILNTIEDIYADSVRRNANEAMHVMQGEVRKSVESVQGVVVRQPGWFERYSSESLARASIEALAAEEKSKFLKFKGLPGHEVCLNELDDALRKEVTTGCELWRRQDQNRNNPIALRDQGEVLNKEADQRWNWLFGHLVGKIGNMSLDNDDDNDHDHDYYRGESSSRPRTRKYPGTKTSRFDGKGRPVWKGPEGGEFVVTEKGNRRYLNQKPARKVV